MQLLHLIFPPEYVEGSSTLQSKVDEPSQSSHNPPRFGESTFKSPQNDGVSSIEHPVLHPSPSTLFPSSHSSPESRVPSPQYSLSLSWQFKVQTLAAKPF